MFTEEEYDAVGALEWCLKWFMLMPCKAWNCKGLSVGYACGACEGTGVVGSLPRKARVREWVTLRR